MFKSKSVSDDSLHKTHCICPCNAIKDFYCCYYNFLIVYNWHVPYGEYCYRRKECGKYKYWTEMYEFELGLFVLGRDADVGF